MKTSAIRMIESWAKTFAATVLTLYIAGETRPATLLTAGGAALAPVILNWLNPSYVGYGKIKL